MKIKTVLPLLLVLTFLLLSTCSNPAGSNNDGTGTFTVSVGMNSRAANYPPDIPPTYSNPGNPTLNELKFELIFTQIAGGGVKTFKFQGGDSISGSIAVGTYAVTIKVSLLDNTDYAQGIALNNPVTITSGTNSIIYIKIFDPDDAQPPVINVHPIGTNYILTDTAAALTVSATSSDGGTISYEWFQNATNSTTGGTSVGTGPSYTPNISALGIQYYYVEITNTNPAAVTTTSMLTSNIAQVSVAAAPVIVNDGVADSHHDSLQDALNSIGTIAGTYTVKIGKDQELAPYTFTGNTIRNITLIAEPPGNSVTVQLSSNGYLFTMGNNLTLTLDDGITLQGRSGNTNPLVRVNSASANLIMETGSAITGNENTTSNNGGGVQISGGAFTMKDGKIYSNTAPNGAGVGISGGSFTMENGVISGNKATSATGGGGGVAIITSGTFIMEDGVIAGNTSSSYGGGVYMTAGSFIMEDGLITGNPAINSGGGVYVGGGSFTMEDGKISDNKSSQRGGGIHINGGSFTMEDGEISGNTSTTNGGGVSLLSGTFLMEDGKISGNISGSYGGGVSLGSSASFTMEDGEISDNTSTGGGGGVYLLSATFNMEGGEIARNTAIISGTSGGGGGVYAAGTGTFTKTPGTSGTIRGYGNDPTDGNMVINSSDIIQTDRGHAVYMNVSKRREKTVLPSESMDSAQAGVPGGWADPP